MRTNKVVIAICQPLIVAKYCSKRWPVGFDARYGVEVLPMIMVAVVPVVSILPVDLTRLKKSLNGVLCLEINKK